MLLKCSNVPASSKGKLARLGNSSIASRIHRKSIYKKHPGKLQTSFKNLPGKKNFPRPATTSLCDNSNDSGLGFEQHLESHYNNNVNYQRSLNILSTKNQTVDQTNQANSAHVAEIEISFAYSSSNVAETSDNKSVDQSVQDADDACCSSDYFYTHAQKNINVNDGSLEKINNEVSSSHLRGQPVAKRMNSQESPGSSTVTSSTISPPPTPQSTTISNQFHPVSRVGLMQLQIMTQPEQQHRARYQTEGSRGAVKDRTGNGFPVVKLNGYNQPAILQVFIGTDTGRVSPHMFYQACKVSGKNSTPCTEQKIDGTMMIEIELKPENDMTVVCDCVGILKERNVDVEHRFPNQSTTRNKKKSTKCRMVFRTRIDNEEMEGAETLEICSQPITCTQPPGIPEICKKSLHSCSVSGGLELFIIGKNFLKDTKVVFAKYANDAIGSSGNPTVMWEASVSPDKEYLQQTHLICVVPPFLNETINETSTVQIYVTSSNKRSESHNFYYTPLKEHMYQPQDSKKDLQLMQDAQQQQLHNVLMQWTDQKTDIDGIHNLMPPPSTVPLNIRLSNNGSNDGTTNEQVALSLKSEYIDENSMQSGGENSMDGCAAGSPTISSSVSASAISGTNEMISYPMGNNDVLGVNMQTNFAAVSQQNQVDIMMTSSNDFKVMDLRIKNESNQMDQCQSPEKLQENMVGNFFTSDTMFQSQQQQIQDNIFAQTTNNMSQISSNTFSQLMKNHNMVMNESMVESTAAVALLSQDIILNSQSAAVLQNTSSNLQEMRDHGNVSSNMILNTSISPTSMMCQNDHMMVQVAQMDTTMMTNMIQPINDVTNVVQPPQPMSNEALEQSLTSTPPNAPAAVKNMILNAAAEILSHEQTISETQSTISALISAHTTISALNASLNPSGMISGPAIENPIILPVVTVEQQQIQNKQCMEIAQMSQMNQISQVPQPNMIMQVNQQQLYANEMPPPSTVNISLRGSKLARKAAENLSQKTEAPKPGGKGTANQTPITITQPFSPTTQDLTSMSDNDLISYINPSVFDFN